MCKSSRAARCALTLQVPFLCRVSRAVGSPLCGAAPGINRNKPHKRITREIILLYLQQVILTVHKEMKSDRNSFTSRLAEPSVNDQRPFLILALGRVL